MAEIMLGEDILSPRPAYLRYYFLMSAVVVAGLDSASKLFIWWYHPELKIGDLGGFVRFHLYQNQGFMLGIGSSLDEESRRLILPVISGLLLLGLVTLLFVRGFSRISLALAWGMVIGGGLANLIERLRLGAVTDFLQFDFGWFQSGIFNLADLFNLFGLVFIASMILLRSRAM
ncbi:MAG: lipoprotein signal peptidase [Planctomycetota bacterium]|jgi:lipoprotein signal peptidase